MSINSIPYVEKYENTSARINELERTDGTKRHWVKFNAHHITDVKVDTIRFERAHGSDFQTITIVARGRKNSYSDEMVDIEVTFFSDNGGDIKVSNDIPKINTAKDYSAHDHTPKNRMLSEFGTITKIT